MDRLPDSSPAGNGRPSEAGCPKCSEPRSWLPGVVGALRRVRWVLLQSSLEMIVSPRSRRAPRAVSPGAGSLAWWVPCVESDIIKEQNRELRGTQRAITRDRAALEKQEKQLELEIKKMAKTGNKEACKVLAKQLVQLRKQKNRTYAVSSKVTSMSTQTKVMNSQMKMAGAMSTTAKTMQAVNKKMDPQKTLQTMQNFQKENMKMEMTEEMINDTLDDIFDASDEEEESQDIVNQVLDEIGIEISGKMAKAPSAARGLPSASTSKAATISDEEIERQLKALGVD
nr:PREDICTED: charged multivesicular body protein 2b [Opisthocomus hoazin]